jgi:hypothetical protein
MFVNTGKRVRGTDPSTAERAPMESVYVAHAETSRRLERLLLGDYVK